jgi:hypothetical protein
MNSASRSWPDGGLRRPSRAVAGVTLAVLAVTFLLAACGTRGTGGLATHAGGAGGRHTSSSSAAVPGGPAGGTARQARVYAQTVLSYVHLPAGATRIAASQAHGRVLDTGLATAANVVEVSRYFRTPLAIAKMSRWALSHWPAHMRLLWHTVSGAVHTVNATARDPLPSTRPDVLEVGYSARSIPASIADAEAGMVVAAAVGGGSLVHAFAYVTWFPRRSGAEFVEAARYRSVTIQAPAGGGASRPVIKTSHSAVLIRKFAAIVDSLKAAPDQGPNPGGLVCQRGYQLTFGPAARTTPGIVVRPVCATAEVVVGGRAQPALLLNGDGVDGGLLAAMRRVFGLS